MQWTNPSIAGIMRLRCAKKQLFAFFSGGMPAAAGAPKTALTSALIERLYGAFFADPNGQRSTDHTVDRKGARLMFIWTQESIRFRRDAAEYAGFDDRIAGRIAERLPQGATVCDAGCGLGYMSLALARSGFAVTAVDSSAEALAVLRENAAGECLPGLRVVQGDVFAMRPQEPYDAMVFCFFGKTEETLGAVRAQCRGTAFLVKKNWAHHRFLLHEKRLERFTFPITCEELDALHVPYTSTTFPVEMGQPFRSLTDAVHFFSLYTGSDAPIPAEQVAERLIGTDSDEFPWYFPSRQPVGLIMLDAEKLPKR